MLKELTVSKEELIEMFLKKEMIDTGKGWLYKGKKVDLAAIHTIEPKYIHDLARAENYKIIYK